MLIYTSGFKQFNDNDETFIMNWDDLKYFIAVCKNGSIRSAAIELKVNHATVSRRINKFEQSLCKRLFERTNSGYVCTKFGEEIYQEAIALENIMGSVSRIAENKNDALSGEIRITLIDLLAEDLLMPIFAEFCRLYPNIELNIIDSTKTFNLANREADIAFRVCNKPPEHLIARKLARLHRSCYMAKSNLSKLRNKGWLEQQNWIGWNDKMRKPVGQIAKDYPRFKSKHKILSAQLQLHACKNGLGIAVIPCFYADKNPDLVRIPPYTSEPKHNFWLLYHPDSRNNAKIQQFIKFMLNKISELKPLMEGNEFDRSLFK